MIIQGRKILEIGEIYRIRIKAPDGWHDNVPVLVLRVATREDYLNFVKEQNLSHLLRNTHGPNYYEVSVD